MELVPFNTVLVRCKLKFKAVTLFFVLYLFPVPQCLQATLSQFNPKSSHISSRFSPEAFCFLKRLKTLLLFRIKVDDVLVFFGKNQMLAFGYRVKE